MNKATSAILALVLAVAAVQDLHAATLKGNPQLYTWEVLYRVTSFEQRLVNRMEGPMKEDARAIDVLEGYKRTYAVLDTNVKTCVQAKYTILETFIRASETVLANCRSPLTNILTEFGTIRTGLYGLTQATLSQAVIGCLGLATTNAVELKAQSTCVATAFTTFAESVEKVLTQVVQADRDFGRVDSSARSCVRSALSLSDIPYRDFTTAVRDCKRTG